MEKRIFFVLALVLSGTAAAYAQQEVTQTASAPVVITASPTLMDSTDPWQLSVQGGGLWADKDHGRLHDGDDIIGRLTYDVTPNVALGAESGGLRFDDRSNGDKYGHLYGVPAMADLVLKMPIAATGNRLVPYIYGAAGVVFWSYAKSGYSDTTGVDARDRTHFAAKPGGGLEYYLTSHVALFVESSYLFSERFKLKGGAATAPDGRVNPDSVYGGGGLKIAF
jgi:opacity protein-like surface antigen